MTCGRVTLFASMTGKRIGLSAWSASAPALLEMRPVGLEISEAVRVTLPVDRLVTRLGVAAD